MAPELIISSKKISNVDLSEEKKRLERFLKSLDSHRYHQIIGATSNHPFFLNPKEMHTLRELPILLPPHTGEKKKKEK